MNNYEKILNKKLAKDLTEEEIFELAKTAARIECSRNTSVNSIMEPDDVYQETLTYLYEKSARGKTGINELKDTLTTKHLINTFQLESRNCINYQLRKPKVKNHLYNTISLDDDVDIHSNTKKIEICYKDTIADTKAFSELEDDIDTESLISNIDDIEDKTLYIKYGEEKCFFSYKKFAELYLKLFNGVRVPLSDLKNTVFKVSTNQPLVDKELRALNQNFKTYILENNILGG